MCRLPTRLVAPSGPPPPEAFDKLRDAKLLDRCDAKTYLFCDGAHSWAKLVKHQNRTMKTKIKIESVAHYKGQFTRTLKHVMKKQSSIAGTQAIDSLWRWLKNYLPHSLKGRVDRDVNPRLEAYVFSGQFRTNCRTRRLNLFEA